tara:strand:+ start:93 stop:1307 length:1215 start_codon:yes stop_codon:yes gene_type:complete
MQKKCILSFFYIFTHECVVSLYDTDFILITITLLQNKRIFPKNLGTMANRDLLADAIADAKAVKEVAIANAKAALEEAFTPHLKDMLAQKINEMEDLEETELAEVDKEKKMEEEKKEMEEMKKDDSMEEMKKDDSMEEELDLEEILAELELEEEKDDSMEEMKKDSMEETYGKKEMEEEKDDSMEEADRKEMEEEMDMKMDDDAEISLEDMSEDELKTMIEDVIEDMIEDGELVPGPNADESEEEEMEDTDDGMEGDADVDIEVDDIDLEEGKEKVDEEKDKMEEELAEAKEVINQLRSDLNEVNLLNSKLLYTNKIFRGKSLTENQKIKVLKAFDKAETVKQAKTIFETLNENLVTKSTKSNIRESLGSASKPAGVAPKRNLNEGIIQEDAMVARFQKLAGIN